MIKPRLIDITSDDGKYRLFARIVTDIDGYSLDYGARYAGAHWTGCFKTADGKFLDYIESIDGAEISFSEYGGGLCQHGVPLNKNTLLYGAYLTGRFTNALEGIDVKKVEKAWYKAYVEARTKQIEQEMGI